MVCPPNRRQKVFYDASVSDPYLFSTSSGVLQPTVKSFSVVENLNVIEDGLPDLSGGQIFCEFDFRF